MPDIFLKSSKRKCIVKLFFRTNLMIPVAPNKPKYPLFPFYKSDKICWQYQGVQVRLQFNGATLLLWATVTRYDTRLYRQPISASMLCMYRMLGLAALLLLLIRHPTVTACCIDDTRKPKCKHACAS